MADYVPRRASKRWLDGDCPAGVLALYDNGGKSADRYTVLYKETDRDHSGTVWINGRAMSSDPLHPQGIGLFFQYPWHELAAWRRSAKKCKWSSLPAEVQRCIRLDLEEV